MAGRMGGESVTVQSLKVSWDITIHPLSLRYGRDTDLAV